MSMSNSGGKQHMPTPQMPRAEQLRATASKPVAPVNHPAVNEYVAEWNRMAHEIDALKKENAQLRYDLDCASNMVKELQHISDHERAEKEKYQRWAVTFDTRCDDLAVIATQLRDQARLAAAPEVAQQIEEKPAPEHLTGEVEEEIKNIAQKFAPKPNP